jgi:hypothetical protein
MRPGLATDRPRASSAQEEALTDDRGEFIVAENPPSNWIPFTWRSLPNFIIFQPGYGYFPRHFATIAAPAPDRIRGPAEDHGEATRRVRAAPADDAGRPAHC